MNTEQQFIWCIYGKNGAIHGAKNQYMAHKVAHKNDTQNYMKNMRQKVEFNISVLQWCIEFNFGAYNQ
ncbi:MAG: hypothetical protein QMD61_09360 [Methanobacterium sp.]|nr:hypothetical protein [Methanobacterium sp.]